MTHNLHWISGRQSRHHVAIHSYATHDAASESVFEQDDLLRAYDRILPLADHYRSIMDVHLRELEGCKHIIDLGCGTGIPTIEFLKRGQLVTAVDISQKSLDILRRKAEAAGCAERLTIIRADIMDLSMIQDQSFDGASSMIVAHLLPDPAAHYRECFRVLKPGATFVVTSRTSGGDQETLVSSTKNSLIRIGRYSELKEDFHTIATRLLRTANGRSASLLLETEIKMRLVACGFSQIEKRLQRTIGVMLTVSASKPKTI